MYLDELDRRFKDADKSFRDKLLDGMRWEDAQLRKFIDKCRLEEWARSTDQEARNAVNSLVDDTLAKKLEATRVHTDMDEDGYMADANGSAMVM